MFLRIAVLAFGIWLGGFLAFSYELPKARPSARNTDGIIALTGGQGRVEHAIAQLERGKARRLLISGVHKNTTARDLRLRTGASKRLFDCCVDIGHAAGNTIGNAVEASAWLDQNHFRSVRIVTSRTHMPRAQLEFTNSLPGVTLVFDPVDVDNSIAARLGEYNKYAARLIWLRLEQL
jgi:uncharacterized SAM-binding protein YcdF (DUF218 family)